MSINGVIVLDKPADMSSARAVAKVKQLFKAKKAGHTGTLDPFATGVLICCINQATRLAQFFLHGDKTYRAVLRLGIETDTQDGTGRVTAEADVPFVSQARLREIIRGFEGRQMQQPPIYAALKHEGVPLYKLARQGKPVQKPARPITVSAIKVTSIDLPDVAFEVTCSSGTYVRALCADIGAAVGCGGHLKQLRRTASSCFKIEQAVTLESLHRMDNRELLEKALIPMNKALQHMPAFVAGPDILQRVANGQRLTADQIPGESIHKPAGHSRRDLFKVVDTELNLKAVLKFRSDGTVYDYCCVFH